MRYRREIDGLRALAVLPVILFHSGWSVFAGGYVGVDVFFVISGYLITTLIITERLAGTFSLRVFYERRVRRILPALFLVMLVCLPFAWMWMLPSDLKEFSKSLLAVCAFASNLLFWREGGYFETPGAYKPLLHTWSLAVEEQYYLLFPMFLALIWRFARRWIGAIFCVLLLLSLAAAQWSSSNHPQSAFYLLPTRGWELLIGAVVALYMNAKPASPPAGGAARPAVEAAGIAGLLLIAYAVVAYDRNIPYPSLYALAPTLGSAMVILYADDKSVAGRLLGSRLLVGIGLLSYSAYLWHQPLFALARIRSEVPVGPSLLAGLGVVALACAYLSWRYVETPFRSRARIGRRTVFAAAAAMSALFVVIGLVGYETDGFARRYPPQDRELAALDVFEAGKYVERRFVELELKPFDQSGRRKVVVIGDSFAQDVVNAAYEGGLTDRMQLTTHWIPTRCGNLFADPRIPDHVDPTRLAICRNSGWYDGAALHRIMSEADEIWVASNWTDWEALRLPDSVRRLNQAYHASVRVFGPKNFGRFSTRGLLRMTVAERLADRNPMVETPVELNARLRASLSAGDYVDVMALLCGPSGACPLFTAGAKLISFDGVHLTKDGAHYFGERLARTLTEHP